MFTIDVKSLVSPEAKASLFRFKQFYAQKREDVKNMQLDHDNCVWFGLWLNGNLDAVSSVTPLPHINLKAALLNWQNIRSKHPLPNLKARRRHSKPYNYVLNNFIPKQCQFMQMKGYSEFYFQIGSDDIYDADDWMIWLYEKNIITLEYNRVLYKGKRRNFYKLDTKRFFGLAKRTGLE